MTALTLIGGIAAVAFAIYAFVLPRLWARHLIQQNAALERRMQEMAGELEASREREAANDDALTGLPNGRELMARIDHALARCVRHGTTLAIMSIDLDNFRKMNDTCGRAVGDAVLIAFGSVLSSAIRRTDTVARLDDDHFVLLVEDLIHGRQDALNVADKIMLAMSQPILHDPIIKASASIGIAMSNEGAEGGDTAVGLLALAEDAMNAARQAGGASFSFA